jgi:hypothetical protein
MRDAVSTIEVLFLALGGCTLLSSIIIYALGEYGWLGFINPITLKQVISGMVIAATIEVFIGLILFILGGKSRLKK